ncbi:MAG: IS200/IS605 family element transposase accessory protein TnpB [Chitinivibrionales bacterium]|nr:IS200/IS605 family element transposase accessory protein TnpB [Chitinivibrionales bacterium]
MQIKKAYRFELRLSQEQRQQCVHFAGCARFVWNKALALKKEAWDNESRNVSRFEIDSLLPTWKEEFPWLKEAPSQSLQQANIDLDQAYKNFFRRVKKGEKPGHPRFKKKGKHDAFRLPQGIKLLNPLNHKTGLVQLPKLGQTKFTMSRPIEGRIKHATISRCAGKWFISFNCDGVEIEDTAPSPTAVGIDRGVAVFAACSDGTRIEAPQPAKRYRRRLAKIQRRLARKKKFSKNWRKERAKLSALGSHMANVRRDALHKASTTLAKNHGSIVLEDLRTRNMTRRAKGSIEVPGKNVAAKSGLNRAILDQGWHAFQTMLVYKANWHGGKVILVAPHHTSQTCSACGNVDVSNRRSQARFVCTCCGHMDNADFNAAKNILAAELAVSACGEAPLGAPAKQEAHKRKAAKAA